MSEGREVVGSQFKKSYSFDEKCDFCDETMLQHIHIIEIKSYGMNFENGNVNLYNSFPKTNCCNNCLEKITKLKVKDG